MDVTEPQNIDATEPRRRVVPNTPEVVSEPEPRRMVDIPNETIAPVEAPTDTPTGAPRIEVNEPDPSEPPAKSEAAAKKDKIRRPVVIVDDLHVKYRVYASGRSVKGNGQYNRSARRGIRIVHALKGVSFIAYANESIGVIGTNGSGKSTLMRTLTGMTPPAQGAVYAKSRPSMIGVGTALIPDLSGERNILLGGLALGMTRKEVSELHDRIVEFADIGEFIDFPMRTYSSGMSARLRFAIASVRKHDILIVDEALAVGDKNFRKRSEARIREIRDEAGTIFLVSHSMGSIRDTCERTIWLNKGELMMDGPTGEVVRAYEEWRK